MDNVLGRIGPCINGAVMDRGILLRHVACLSLLTGGYALAADGIMIGGFRIDRTEVTVGEFREFVKATGLRTLAEKQGGGSVYESGWVRKPGWNWQAPYGEPAADREPAVHVTFPEAQAYCRWAGKRLPTEAEWIEAAYTERRASPPAPFVRGKIYPYPTGESPAGANCLDDCGRAEVKDRSAVLSRGRGHALAGATRPGVNGLHDMGANVWEWVDGGSSAERLTLGGSWWYGSAQMHRDHRASKPADTAVVYIGFRCANDLKR